MALLEYSVTKLSLQTHMYNFHDFRVVCVHYLSTRCISLFMLLIQGSEILPNPQMSAGIVPAKFTIFHPYGHIVCY